MYIESGLWFHVVLDEGGDPINVIYILRPMAFVSHELVPTGALVALSNA